jgi:hypothetical protein
MKKLFLSLMVLLSFNNVMHAVLVRLPDAATLTQRLQGFEDFVEKTNIIRQLAGIDMEAIPLAISIQCNVDSYNQHPSAQALTEAQRSAIFRAIFVGFPEAIKELSNIVLLSYR